MDFALIFVAFVFGFIFKFISLPPLIGYLMAGFVLNYLGFENNDTLTTIANLGITIMLFTIGLKLNIRDLTKTEIWLTSVTHSLVFVALLAFVIVAVSTLGISYFAGLSIEQSALVAFALSFSSTVCVVKILEESGESKTRHGKVAIGILVMQDIFAVLFLVMATGKIPSIYALLLFLLIPAVPLFRKFLDIVGHGELLPLGGLTFALGAYFLFELVGVKGDLGALVAGVLLAGSYKAAELSKSLLAFKDLFLVGFFLTIGLSAMPNLEMLMIAAFFILFLPIKYALFFSLFALCKLRARTSYLASLVMSNYSEFGLIVMSVAVSAGMISQNWLVVMAMALSFSFVITSVFYKTSHTQYARFKNNLKRFQSSKPLSEDRYPSLKDAEILVIGMGRVGKGAFSALSCSLGNKVWGMDADFMRIEKIKTINENVIIGDGENIDLWENIDISHLKLVLLAVPSIDDSKNITAQLRNAEFSGKVAAIARYEDEVEPLLNSGVDKVFNFFTEAGLGFAEESINLVGK